MLTAAHCVYNNAGAAVTGTFEPSAGSTTAFGCGKWDLGAITSYSQWTTSACYAGTSQPDSCRRYDIALVRLTPQTGACYWGGLSYGWYTSAYLSSSSVIKYHKGYPGCGQPGAPTGCTGTRLWGDGVIASLGYWRLSDRLVDHSSDASPGHSGGPMHMTNAPGVVIWGVRARIARATATATRRSRSSTRQ